MNSEYVAIAIGALSRPPVGDPASQQERDADAALRRWAVGVLDATSPIELTGELRVALQQGDVSLEPASGEAGSPVDAVARRLWVYEGVPVRYDLLPRSERAELVEEYVDTRTRLSIERPDWGSLPRDQQDELVLDEMGGI